MKFHQGQLIKVRLGGLKNAGCAFRLAEMTLYLDDRLDDGDALDFNWGVFLPEEIAMVVSAEYIPIRTRGARVLSGHMVGCRPDGLERWIGVLAGDQLYAIIEDQFEAASME